MAAPLCAHDASVQFSLAPPTLVFIGNPRYESPGESFQIIVLSLMTKNKVDSLEALKTFDAGGYKYSKKDSGEFSPVFLRK